MKDALTKSIRTNKKTFIILLIILTLISTASSLTSNNEDHLASVFFDSFFTLGEVFLYIFLFLLILDFIANTIEMKYSSAAKVKVTAVFVLILFIYGIVLIYDYSMWSDKQQALVNKDLITSVNDRCNQVDKVSLYEEDGFYHFRCGNIVFINNEWSVRVEDEPQLSEYLMHR